MSDRIGFLLSLEPLDVPSNSRILTQRWKISSRSTSCGNTAQFAATYSDIGILLLFGDAIGSSTRSHCHSTRVSIWIVLIAGYLEPPWTAVDGTVFQELHLNITGCTVFADGAWLS